mgnify:FL=1
MIAVLQRVSEAEVTILGQVAGQIGEGLMILLGIEDADDSRDVEWLTSKITKRRIFGDDEGLMNRSLLDIEGEALIVSQFTLHASTKKGNRPSFIRAARPYKAIPQYDVFVQTMGDLLGKANVATGEFGADMKVRLVNDGPVTISIDSRNRQ